MQSNQNSYTARLMGPLGKELVSHKVEHTFTINLSNSTHRYSPKRNENKYPQKVLYGNVHSNFVIAKIWKQPECPTTGDKMNKLCDTINMDTINTMDESQKADEEVRHCITPFT